MNMGKQIRESRLRSNLTQDKLAEVLGVTPQAVVMHSQPEFCITHAPGHMFLTDVKNVQLKY